MDGPAEDILSLEQMPQSAVLLRRVSALALEAPQGRLLQMDPTQCSSAARQPRLHTMQLTTALTRNDQPASLMHCITSVCTAITTQWSTVHAHALICNCLFSFQC
jgi:hypothetical protein